MVWPNWQSISERIAFLAAHYDESGNSLKQRIYSNFPSLADQQLGSHIAASPVEEAK